jgi:uracil-DNA glycosylase family 4
VNKLYRGSILDIYKQFDEDLRSCQKCKSILGDRCVNPLFSEEKVEPRPIISGIMKKPIMLIGQAPGIKEYETRKPFQGQAGQNIRNIFQDMGVSNFDEYVWSSAVVKCFPGRKKVEKKESSAFRIEDEKPSPMMEKNCRSFLLRQIELVEPNVIVTLGVFPLKAYLRLQGRPVSEGTLKNFVGKKESWKGKSIVFFPHTSGSSFWLNSPENKGLFCDAKTLLRQELLNLEIIK